MDLGKAIKEIRKKKGVNQKELSEMCDISVNAISNIELNKVSPRTDTFEKICKSLGVSVAYVTVSSLEEKDADYNKSVFKALGAIKELLIG